MVYESLKAYAFITCAEGLAIVVEIAILAMLIIAAGIIQMSRTRTRNSRGQRTPEGPSMVYAPGSRDVASEVYWPAIRGSIMAFPLSKKEEREKTETHTGKK